MKLEQKNVFITGSSRGIGLAIAHKFASLGSNIVLNSRGEISEELLNEFKPYGVKVLAISGDVSDFACPLVGNTEAKVMENERIAELLTRQVKEPVRFYESIEVMQEAGVTRFIEIGPGKVLSGFVKKIDKTAQLANVEDQASLQALLEN